MTHILNIVLLFSTLEYCFSKIKSIDFVREEDKTITEILSNPKSGLGEELLSRIEKYNEILQTNLNLAKTFDPDGLKFAKELKLDNGPNFLRVTDFIKSKITHYQEVFNYSQEQCYNFEDNVYWTRNLWGSFKDINTFDGCGK
uniref:SCP domain-containing protein n=1 Tax=Clastoptera arizonana TaxID=38151 RepID=A0A1B6CKU6_9HEMI